MERFYDPGGRIIAIQVQWLPFAGARVHGRPLTLGNGHRGELFLSSAEQVHVALGRQGILGQGAGKAVNGVERHHGIGPAGSGVRNRAATLVFLQWRIREHATHGGCQTVGHGHGGILNHLPGAGAVALHVGQQVQLLEAQGDMQKQADLITHAGVDEQTVQIGFLQPGIFQRQENGLGSEVFGVPIDAAHFGDTQAGDGGRAVH